MKRAWLGLMLVAGWLARDEVSAGDFPAPVFEDPVRYELEVSLDTPLDRDITVLGTVEPRVPFRFTATSGAVAIALSGTLENPVNGKFPLKLTILENQAPVLNDKGTNDYALALDVGVANGKMVRGVVSQYWVQLRPHKREGYDHAIDDQPRTPLIYHDRETGDYYYVESDGRHVSAFTAAGKLRWCRDPFADARLEPYRSRRPVIAYIGPTNWKYPAGHFIGISFDSSQFGDLDAATGNFRYRGRD